MRLSYLQEVTSYEPRKSEKTIMFNNPSSDDQHRASASNISQPTIEQSFENGN